MSVWSASTLVLRILRAHFSVEHIDVALSLLEMMPHAGDHKTRLTAAAYRRGVIAGLSYDSRDPGYPECPYDSKDLGNWARGKNDPRQAWRDGSRDALRIRDIILRPDRAIVPTLYQREFKALTPELQRAHDAVAV